MAEQRKSEGLLVTLEAVTAASNMAAGTLVALSGTLAYTHSSATTGFGATATMGYNFVGILDETVSAGQSPITVWTDGVFKLPLNSASTSGNIYAGLPVWTVSGTEVGTPGSNGAMSIGTLVGIEGATWGATGAGYVYVKIRPGAVNWTIAATAALSSTAPLPGAFPQAATR